MGMAGDAVVVVVVVVVGQYDSYKKQIYAHYYIIIYAFNNQVSVSASQGSCGQAYVPRETQ